MGKTSGEIKMVVVEGRRPAGGVQEEKDVVEGRDGDW